MLCEFVGISKLIEVARLIPSFSVGTEGLSLKSCGGHRNPLRLGRAESDKRESPGVHSGVHNRRKCCCDREV